MTKTSSTEAQAVWRNLAISIADAIEHSECPRDLADILSEAVNPLEELLAGSGSGYSTITATLRGLVARAGARAEAPDFAPASCLFNFISHTDL